MRSHPLEKNYKCHISEKKRSLRHRHTLGLVGKSVPGCHGIAETLETSWLQLVGLTGNRWATAYLLLWPL